MLATPFVALSGVRVSGVRVSGVRVSSGGCAGVRSAGVSCPRVSCPRVSCPRSPPRRDAFVEPRCGGPEPRGWAGSGFGVVTRRVCERPGCWPGLAVAALAAVVLGGGVGCGPGRRLGMRSGGGCVHVLPPGRPGTAGLRAGRPSGWLGITGRGAGCARRSPTRCMSSCVSSGAGSSAGGPHEVLDQGGDYGAWSLDGVGPESPGSGRAGGFDCEKGARPHRGPGMQRARPGRGWQGSDLQELWWARQGLNLRLLPCQIPRASTGL
jgi:hypothetical protein